MLLSRLSLLLSDLGRLQETQIRAHLPALLQSASNVQSLESQVRDVRRGLDDLEVGVERLSRPTRTSLARLQRDQERFKRLNAVQDLLRQASQYVHVARRLETHLQVLFDEEDDRQDAQVEQAMVDSAHCLESLTTATTPPLSSLQFIQSYTPSIQSARAQVIDKMETCIVTGLRDLSPSLLSSSLQTADILGVLSDLVSDLLHDLTDVVRRCVVRAVGVVADHRREWDVALSEQQQDGGAHASSSSPTPYRSKRAQTRNHATTSSPVTALQDSFCQQLHTLMTVEMTAVCSKIYLLQRVLGLMSARGGGEEDADNNPRTLLDEGVKVGRSRAIIRCKSAHLCRTPADPGRTTDAPLLAHTLHVPRVESHAPAIDVPLDPARLGCRAALSFQRTTPHQHTHTLPSHMARAPLARRRLLL